MKKYIKPLIEIVSFDVESSVMAEITPEPTFMPADMSRGASLSANYIPTDIENKVWTKVDDENWNWDE